jgi:hypothetical protein
MNAITYKLLTQAIPRKFQLTSATHCPNILTLRSPFGITGRPAIEQSARHRFSLNPDSVRRIIYIEQSIDSIPLVRKALFMAKRRGNPNWGKPEPIGPIVPTITEFEQVVREYKLTPDQYLRSTRLREWARRNKNSKYIPEPLLEAWGFEIESTL